MNKIGIFGGTFNPVHKGHLYAAKQFKEQCGLDLVYVIPNNMPHMEKDVSASAEDRLQMLNLCFQNEEGFLVSDMEIRRGGVSYTCDTIQTLTEQYGNIDIYLYCGEDQLEKLPRWKHVEWICERVIFAFSARGEQSIDEKVNAFRERFRARTTILRFSPLPISSTEIRKGQYNLCPHEVEEYLSSRRIYQ